MSEHDIGVFVSGVLYGGLLVGAIEWIVFPVAFRISRAITRYTRAHR